MSVTGNSSQSGQHRTNIERYAASVRGLSLRVFRYSSSSSASVGIGFFFKSCIGSCMSVGASSGYTSIISTSTKRSTGQAETATPETACPYAFRVLLKIGFRCLLFKGDARDLSSIKKGRTRFSLSCLASYSSAWRIHPLFHTSSGRSTHSNLQFVVQCLLMFPTWRLRQWSWSANPQR